jgi:predicted aspartyl protease
MMSQRIFNSLVLALACLLLSQCASGPGGFSRAPRDSRLARLGYEPVDLQKIRGDVRLSGIFGVNNEPMRFLIDSGANSTDLDATLAKKAGLVEDRSVRVVTRGALGRKISSGRGYGMLQIGPMYARDFPFTIAPSTGRKTSTSSYAGQVGLDALFAVGALIDIPAGRMWVPGERRYGNAGPTPPLLGSQDGLGAKVLPLETAGRLPHLILRGRLQGREVTWVVDTGAEISVMATESFERFALPSRPSNSRMIDASGDRIALRYARLQNVKFGNVNVTEFDIAVAPLGEVRQFFRDARGRPVDGILGMDFLTTGQALLDTRSGLIYLGNP